MTARPKRVANRKTLDIQNFVSVYNCHPVEFLLRVAMDKNNPLNVRVDAAKAAAPYVAPKLSNIEVTHNQPDELTADEIKEKLRQIVERRPELLKVVTGETLPPVTIDQPAEVPAVVEHEMLAESIEDDEAL